ncbi:hypothetical protein EV122DRAFT_284976 [Schizophyllum commune]
MIRTPTTRRTLSERLRMGNRLVIKLYVGSLNFDAIDASIARPPGQYSALRMPSRPDDRTPNPANVEFALRQLRELLLNHARCPRRVLSDRVYRPVLTLRSHFPCTHGHLIYNLPVNRCLRPYTASSCYASAAVGMREVPKAINAMLLVLEVPTLPSRCGETQQTFSNVNKTSLPDPKPLEACVRLLGRLMGECPNQSLKVSQAFADEIVRPRAAGGMREVPRAKDATSQDLVGSLAREGERSQLRSGTSAVSIDSVMSLYTTRDSKIMPVSLRLRRNSAERFESRRRVPDPAASDHVRQEGRLCRYTATASSGQRRHLTRSADTTADATPTHARTKGETMVEVSPTLSASPTSPKGDIDVAKLRREISSPRTHTLPVHPMTDERGDYAGTRREISSIRPSDLSDTYNNAETPEYDADIANAMQDLLRNDARAASALISPMDLPRVGGTILTPTPWSFKTSSRDFGEFSATWD